MSDMFTDLAARALGEFGSLRPRPVSRFAPVASPSPRPSPADDWPSLDGFEESESEAALPIDPVPAIRPPVAPAPGPPRRRPDLLPRDGLPDRLAELEESEHPRPIARAEAPPAVPRSDRGPAAAPPDPWPAAVPERPSREAGAGVRQAFAERVEEDEAAPDRPAPIAATPARRPTVPVETWVEVEARIDDAPRRVETPGRAAPRPAGDRATPPPALPRPAPRRESPASRPRVAPAQVVRSADTLAPPTPPERTINVSIGRIEVRVGTPPAPAARRPAPAPAPPMPLEAYARSRGAGGGR